MSPPWMPLYIADYRLDTARLSAAEHGAYLLLIMEYWAAGSLPSDDRQLARVACMTDREWRAARPVVQQFFRDGWKHKRIDEELQKAAATICKRRAAAVHMHSKRRAKADAHAHAHAPAKAGAGHDIRAGTPSTKSSEANASGGKPPSEPASDSAEERRQLYRRGKEVFRSGGVVTDLLKAKGGNVALTRAVVEQASQAADPNEYAGRILHPKPNGKHDDAKSVHAAAQRLLVEARNAERELQSDTGGRSGDPHVRMLAPH